MAVGQIVYNMLPCVVVQPVTKADLVQRQMRMARPRHLQLWSLWGHMQLQ